MKLILDEAHQYKCVDGHYQDTTITLDPKRTYIIHEGKVREAPSPVCIKDVNGVEHWVQLTTNLSRLTEVTQ
jgi:hypothetical protein